MLLHLTKIINLPILVRKFQKNFFLTGIQQTINYVSEATFELNETFETFKLAEFPSTTINVTREEALKYYTQMYTIRRLEVMTDKLYKQQKIRGFVHLYTGQEACAVGMRAAMREQDNIIAGYRIHGWSFVMGNSPQSILAELTGRQSGCTSGKGGSGHMYGKKFYGGLGIAGTTIPIGAGIALACKYKNDDSVCLALYGDGAANQGQAFEAYNMAYLWKLPCIFICENNLYGMGTKVERAASNPCFFTHGDPIPGIQVDGMNVLAIKSATEFAIEYVLKNGPLIMEANTYRYGGHSLADPGRSYRSREEIHHIRQKRDPIFSFKELCIEKELMSAEETKKIDSKIRKEIDKAASVARKDKPLPLSGLWTDVYSNNLEPKLRGIIGYDFEHISENKDWNQ